jgi:hypothetical protein
MRSYAACCLAVALVALVWGHWSADPAADLVAASCGLAAVVAYVRVKVFDVTTRRRRLRTQSKVTISSR